jgi:succinate dehydrogenase / fumarate reductase flavoprotein subunit/L-aspartate oxidase
MAQPTIGIIGSGGAGLMAALAASTQSDVTLITDRSLGKSNTAMAQGGLQFPFPTEASVRSLQDDMIRSARVPLDRALNSLFVHEVREAVLELERLGLDFDRDETGAWRRRAAGGLSEARVVGVGDRIGPALIRVLRRAVSERSIEVVEWTTANEIRPSGLGFDVHLVGRAPQVRRFDALVVCTGGRTYARAQEAGEWTTNPPNENALMYQILQRLGLAEVHEAYFQYQPLGIVAGDARGFGKAVPESILTRSIRIVDANQRPVLERGERPDRLTLCERMFACEAAGTGVPAANGHVGFWLLLDDIPPTDLERDYPATVSFLRGHGILDDRVLVRPFLHYHLGGFRIDTRCQSTLPGLFLAGEVTGGIHGRNRLMGNGLTDALVHGRRAGLAAVAYAEETAHGIR